MKQLQRIDSKPSVNLRSNEVWAKELVERYGDSEKLLIVFNPSQQQRFSANITRCFDGLAPSLRRVSLLWGTEIALKWTEIQLFDLFEFVGIKSKPDPRIIAQTANVIVFNFSQFKLTEMMYFFNNFKSGKYGSFYGTIDPIKLTEALRVFKRERYEILDRIEREKEKERRDTYQGISYEEWYSNRGGKEFLESIEFEK